MKLALTPEQRIEMFGKRKGKELETRLQVIIQEHGDKPFAAELIGMIETAMIITSDIGNERLQKLKKYEDTIREIGIAVSASGVQIYKNDEDEY